MFNLILLVTLLVGHPPRVREYPWYITATFEAPRGQDFGHTVVLPERYSSFESCEEGLAEVALSSYKPGLVSLECESAPETT